MTAESTQLWGDEAWETCPFCLQSYTYELELRCVDCDRPMCPVCAIHVRPRRQVTCRECRPADEGTAGAGSPREREA